jgi:hypothetical protein
MSISSQPRISEVSLSPQTIDECFRVDLLNFSSGVIELWREFQHLLEGCYNRSYNRKMKERFICDSNRYFSENNLTVEPNYRREQLPEPFHLQLDEVRECKT